MNKRGFTLIEVLAAIVLIMLALIPIMVIVPQMIENSLNTQRLTTVIFLAEGKMEEVRRDAINNFVSSQDKPVTAFALPYAEYKYTVTDNEGAGIKIIQIRAWHDKDADNTLDANEQSITIDSKIADRG
ncbi:MAG: type II secretion system protein [Candidatus Omnitrophota bacterium]